MTMPQSDTVTLDTVPSADTATLHSWQRLTLGCELTLHAAAREPVHAPSLQADFARLDATVGPSGRNFLANDGSWAAIPLIERSSQVTGSLPPRGCPTPALARMPSVQALLSCHDWHVLSVYVLRQPPHGVLPWHFDSQAVHLSECRLLLPIHAPPGAVTWIGHDGADRGPSAAPRPCAGRSEPDATLARRPHRVIAGPLKRPSQEPADVDRPCRG